MDLIKTPYEISLWEDRLVFVGKNGGPYSDIEEARGDTIISQFYKEVKIATIGSNTMDSPARALNAKLSRKINGENQLTFSMYYRYWDDDSEDFVYNPFNALMVNERKVKLRLGEPGPSCKWYDFIIKNMQENSDSKSFSYTCKDQFVNELSKSGFELELDNELENNMGTIDFLAEKILEGSDWQLDTNNVSNLKQYKEEPLYRAMVTENTILAKDMQTNEEVLIPVGENIYIFYSIWNDKNPKLQFLFSEKDSFETNDDLIIDKSVHQNYEVEVTYDENGNVFVDGQKSIKVEDVALSTDYRGNRLIRQTITKYDSTIDKYVTVYEDANEKEYYGFTQSKYISPAIVNNYVANPNSFTSTTGWQTDANQIDFQLEAVKVNNGEYASFLKFKSNDSYILNAGISGNRSIIRSFSKGDKYIFRIKYWQNGGYSVNFPQQVVVSEYSMNEDKEYELAQSPLMYFVLDRTLTFGSEYIWGVAECQYSISEAQLLDWDFKIGLFLKFRSGIEIYLEDAQLFPYVTYGDDQKICVPGGDAFSEIKTEYIYYQPDADMQSIEDLKPSYKAYVDSTNYKPKYENNEKQFTKVRSISAKESNRFNLIQSLCETFECWPVIDIKRDLETGEIEYEREDDGSYRQRKFIGFKEYIDVENYAGFRYGINSKSIQRTVDSAAIVSKMIVKDNANEFAPNGFCSIARASENPTGENFLINFDHYVRHGLLNFNVVTNDLYLDQDGYLGYYKKLKALNANRDANIDIQAGLLVDIAHYNSSYTTYKTSYDAALEEQLVIEKNIRDFTGKDILDFENEVPELLKNGEFANSDKLTSYWMKWCQCQNIFAQHKPLYEKAHENLIAAEEEYKKITEELKTNTEAKRALAIQFYKKYSRFIQEGSWIKEDYTDPNLYYLDSESTLHTSAQPKVTYNISVIDVSPLKAYEEDYKYYEFDIGHKTYIEDPEFFGWSLKSGIKAPYREEVIISEIISELDSPEKNQIKVQNYKTQFEDLFQRITASTQQAEYHTGEFTRAASVVETNGTISVDTLQNSLINNSLKLSNASDQSVVWDETGITATSLTNPSEMVRLIAGGIFLSKDGGQSWQTGITGSGINASYLTTGQINTNQINILSGSFPTFRWDEKGLSAYKFSEDSGTNLSTFVRFDQYGIYGIAGDKDFVAEEEDDVWDAASYALTWKGFQLKNDNGSVRISSTEDIQVLANEKERIRIGRIGKTDNNEAIHGIRISNAREESVMETDDQGELWLKKRLRIGTDSTSTVELGYLDATRDNSIHEVIHAGRGNQEFIVYEDGKMRATGAEFTGIINATGGKIGNMTIEDVNTSAYRLEINSDLGYAVKDGVEVTLTAKLYDGTGAQVAQGLSYQWYDENGNPISGANEQKHKIVTKYQNSSYLSYGCKVTLLEEQNEGV